MRERVRSWPSRNMLEKLAFMPHIYAGINAYLCQLCSSNMLEYACVLIVFIRILSYFFLLSATCACSVCILLLYAVSKQSSWSIPIFSGRFKNKLYVRFCSSYKRSILSLVCLNAYQYKGTWSVPAAVVNKSENFGRIGFKFKNALNVSKLRFILWVADH